MWGWEGRVAEYNELTNTAEKWRMQVGTAKWNGTTFYWNETEYVHNR